MAIFIAMATKMKSFTGAILCQLNLAFYLMSLVLNDIKKELYHEYTPEFEAVKQIHSNKAVLNDVI